MDSRRNPAPPKIVNRFLNFPSIESSGTVAMATDMMLMGIKQTMNNDEIITTILTTFLFEMDMVSALKDDDAFWRHLLLLLSSNTRIIVQVMIITNALSGTTKQLSGKNMASKLSRSLT